MNFHCVNMDCVGWLWLVVLCSRLIRASAANGMGRKVLTDLERVSLILLEMGCWETVVCVWAILAIFTILSISMARSKNIRKGKATSSFMERAIKKRKVDTSHIVKKGKGKWKGSSSESEKESEREDEEIEVMFAESSESQREKWVQSIERRGFHCERGMRIETFLFTHPIRVVIQDHNMQFVSEDVKGYLPTVVKEFYSNLRENQNVDTLLETTILGKQLMVSLDSITRSLNYVRLATHDRPYPLRAITKFDASLFANTMYTNLVPMGAFCARSSSQGN